MARRAGVIVNGMEPAGMTASSSSASAAPMVHAITLTTSAWSTTPANSVRDRAPIALSTPYMAMRSTVSSTKKRATTTTAMITVTPMIWLNVLRCCSTPPIALAAAVVVSVEVAPSVASSMRPATASASVPPVSTTSAWNVPSGRTEPGRFALSASRHVAGDAQSVP